MYSEQNEEENQISKATLSIFFKKCYVFENNPDHGNIINSACNHVLKNIIKIPICLISVAFERFDFLSHSVQRFVHKFLCRVCK